MPNTMEKHRRRYVFHGEVQGVGFRYHAVTIADYLGLTGYVRNNPDGSVTAEVQGTKRDLVDFVDKICNSSGWIDVRDIESEDIPEIPDERSFRIEY